MFGQRVVTDGCDAVGAAMDRLGVGRFAEPAASVPTGRNDNWFGGTTAGRRVFVKRIVGSDAEVTAALRRTDAFYRTHSAAGSPSALPTAAMLGQDERAAVQVFEHLDGVRAGDVAARDDQFGPALGAAAGTAIATLHGLEARTLAEAERALSPARAENLFHGLSLDAFYESSQAQLQAWRLVQQDAVVVAELTRLEEPGADPVPVHGDLRLDQFLVAGDRLHLTDWEAFQLGDPARDVGAFVGEWLHHAVVRFLTSRGSTRAGRALPVPNIVLTARWEPYGRVRPVVEAFWRSYRLLRPQAADLSRRATVFAGCHLLERLFIDSLPRPRLDGVGHTLYRLARTILLSPSRFTPVLGLGALDGGGRSC